MEQERQNPNDALKKPANEVQQIVDAFRGIVRLLRLSSQSERDLGLSPAQFFILHKLAETDKLSVNELAVLSHTHQSSVSLVVQGLVQKGLVAKAYAGDDARRLELTLTPAAKPLLRKAPAVAQDRLMEAMGRLPKTTQKQLAEGLKELVERAGLADGPAPVLVADSPRD